MILTMVPPLLGTPQLRNEHGDHLAPHHVLGHEAHLLPWQLETAGIKVEPSRTLMMVLHNQYFHRDELSPEALDPRPYVLRDSHMVQ